MSNFSYLLTVLTCFLPAVFVWAGEPCRIAFDMGSSGIRAGQSGRSAVMRTNIDYLTPLSTGHGLADTLPLTIAALRELPSHGGFDNDCIRLGGGFSAWRIASQEDREKLASDLEAIRTSSGVAVLVIPQRQEGAYAFQGARQLLNKRLTTSHILDIGGGSLQVAGASHSFGAPFGQKLWHRELCKALRNSSELPCSLQPMTAQDLDAARRLLRNHLQGIARPLPPGATMTAISPPVTKGVAPAVAHMFNRPANLGEISLIMLRATLEFNASLGLDDMAQYLEIERKHAAYLISDLVLVEGLMQATGRHDLSIAEIELTNLPGLLADDRAYNWAVLHECYVKRLRTQGIAAYYSDSTTCSPQSKTGRH